MEGATAQDIHQVQTVCEVRRSWWRKLPRRMSVRSLMIVVLLVGAVFGWVVHPVQVQRQAVAAIEYGGGRVLYDWQFKSMPGRVLTFDPKGRPKGPKWLIDYLGHDYFGHVESVQLGPRNTNDALKQVEHFDKLRRISFFTGVDIAPVVSAGMKALPSSGLSRFQGLFELITADLSPPQFNGASFKFLKNMTRLERLEIPFDIAVSDADMKYLSRLTALTMLDLHDPRITDVGFANLRDMTRLTNLRVFGTRVTGAGLKSLGAMTGLKHLALGQTRVDDLAAIGHLRLLASLELSQTPIDDRGLAPVAGLIGLTRLELDRTNVTSVSYAHLEHLTKLTRLSLGHTRVGDEGSAALAELTALSSLDLDNTRITDVTLAHLTKLLRLRNLNLLKTEITDRGLAALIECNALKTLNVRDTRVTKEGLGAFRKARPEVNVVR